MYINRILFQYILGISFACSQCFLLPQLLGKGWLISDPLIQIERNENFRIVNLPFEVVYHWKDKGLDVTMELSIKCRSSVEARLANNKIGSTVAWQHRGHHYSHISYVKWISFHKMPSQEHWTIWTFSTSVVTFALHWEKYLSLIDINIRMKPIMSNIIVLFIVKRFVYQ